jgi:hypothetical protein
VLCRSLSVLFLLAIVFSVLLRFTASDYPFGICKLFFWPLCCLSFFDSQLLINQIKIINVCLGTEMVYYCDLQFLRKVCWYHRGNQTPWIEEGQTTQWPNGGGSRRELPTMGKQLVNFIICGCESSAPFLKFTKLGAIGLYVLLGNQSTSLIKQRSDQKGLRGF